MLYNAIIKKLGGQKVILLQKITLEAIMSTGLQTLKCTMQTNSNACKMRIIKENETKDYLLSFAMTARAPNMP